MEKWCHLLRDELLQEEPLRENRSDSPEPDGDFRVWATPKCSCHAEMGIWAPPRAEAGWYCEPRCTGRLVGSCSPPLGFTQQQKSPIPLSFPRPAPNSPHVLHFPPMFLSYKTTGDDLPLGKPGLQRNAFRAVASALVPPWNEVTCEVQKNPHFFCFPGMARS